MDGLCFRNLFKEVVNSLVYKGVLVGVLVSAEGGRIYVLDPRVVLIPKATRPWRCPIVNEKIGQGTYTLRPVGRRIVYGVSEAGLSEQSCYMEAPPGEILLRLW